MNLRHEYLKGEPVNTHLGTVQLDQRGVVINIHEIKGGVDALQHIPGFLQADLFPPENYTPGEKPPEPEKEPEKTYTDEDYWKVIEELLTDEDNLNAERQVNIDTLTYELRRRKMPIISGARRKDITNRYRNQEVKVEEPKSAE